MLLPLKNWKRTIATVGIGLLMVAAPAHAEFNNATPERTTT